MKISINDNIECKSESMNLKEQVKQAIIDSSVEGHVDLEDLTNNILSLGFVSGSILTANSKTISHRECYGDGSMIYPMWKEVNYR